MYFAKKKETLPPLQGFRPIDLDDRASASKPSGLLHI
jgi:hypothetical protein